MVQPQLHVLIAKMQISSHTAKKVVLIPETRNMILASSDITYALEGHFYIADKVYVLNRLVETKLEVFVLMRVYFSFVFTFVYLLILRPVFIM